MSRCGNVVGGNAEPCRGSARRSAGCTRAMRTVNGACTSRPRWRRRGQALPERAVVGRDHGSDEGRRLHEGAVGVRSVGGGRPQARWWSCGEVTATERNSLQGRIHSEIAQCCARQFDFRHGRMHVDPAANACVAHIPMGVVPLVIGAGYLGRPETMLGVRLMRHLVCVLTMVCHAMRQAFTRMGDEGDGDEATGYELPGQRWGAHRRKIYLRTTVPLPRPCGRIGESARHAMESGTSLHRDGDSLMPHFTPRHYYSTI